MISIPIHLLLGYQFVCLRTSLSWTEVALFCVRSGTPLHNFPLAWSSLGPSSYEHTWLLCRISIHGLKTSNKASVLWPIFEKICQRVGSSLSTIEVPEKHRPWPAVYAWIRKRTPNRLHGLFSSWWLFHLLSAKIIKPVSWSWPTLILTSNKTLPLGNASLLTVLRM